jgi:hypothetical protein
MPLMYDAPNSEQQQAGENGSHTYAFTKIIFRQYRACTSAVIIQDAHGEKSTEIINGE